MDLQDGTAVN
jgi:hypothetical protein